MHSVDPLLQGRRRDGTGPRAARDYTSQRKLAGIVWQSALLIAKLLFLRREGVGLVWIFFLWPHPKPYLIHLTATQKRDCNTAVAPGPWRSKLPARCLPEPYACVHLNNLQPARHTWPCCCPPSVVACNVGLHSLERCRTKASSVGLIALCSSSDAISANAVVM